jgi:MFS family permease
MTRGHLQSLTDLPLPSLVLVDEINEMVDAERADPGADSRVCTSVPISPHDRAGERRRVMIFGMSLAVFTAMHVVISLIGIVAGLIAVVGILSAMRLPGWTALFLAATVLTSVTGFFFPVAHVLPSHIVGVISLLVLAVTIVALYVKRFAGSWRWIYVTGTVLALYLNVFVGVIQAFLKIPILNRLAPTQSEGPFIIAQLMVMALFVVLGVLAVRKFRPAIPTPG